MIQATSFSIVGRKVPVDTMIHTITEWPMYTAAVYNSDGSQLDYRQGFNEYELYKWVDSFGFEVVAHRGSVVGKYVE